MEGVKREEWWQPSREQRFGAHLSSLHKEPLGHQQGNVPASCPQLVCPGHTLSRHPDLDGGIIASPGQALAIGGPGHTLNSTRMTTIGGEAGSCMGSRGRLGGTGRGSRSRATGGGQWDETATQEGHSCHSAHEGAPRQLLLLEEPFKGSGWLSEGALINHRDDFFLVRGLGRTPSSIKGEQGAKGPAA
jgi:hypothetical protein